MQGETGRRGGARYRGICYGRWLQSGWEPLRARHCSPEPEPRTRAPSPAPATGSGGQGPAATRPASRRTPAPQAPASPRATMVCGGFSCSKNCLCALNLLYTVSSPRPVAPARGRRPLPRLSIRLCPIPRPLRASHAPASPAAPARDPKSACRSLRPSFIVALAPRPALCSPSLSRPSPLSHPSPPSHLNPSSCTLSPGHPIWRLESSLGLGDRL